jgi:RNA polymerase sigma-32 factor
MVKEDTGSEIKPVLVEEKGGALTRIDPLVRLMRVAESFPILKPEEEKELFRRYKEEGDIKAAHMLVSSHLRLVIKIAMEYRNAYYNLLDLVQEGSIGLMVAVKKFDPSKGARLSSYATWWIRSYILKYILDNFRLIKVGTTKAQRRLFYHLIHEKQKIEAMGYIADSNRMLSERLNVTVSEVEEMTRRLTSHEYSLEAPTDATDEGRILEEFISDDDVPIDEKLAKQEVKNILEEKLEEFAKGLSERDLKILRERLLAETPRTLQSIADEYGISKERARQLEERIINNIKQFFKKSGISIEDMRDLQ